MNSLFSSLIENALRLTSYWHREHKLAKEDLSFTIHTSAVGMLLSRAGMSETIIAAGLCHDLLDYTHCPKDEIVEATNQEVFDLIKSLSQDNLLHPEKEWEKRKKRYIEAVRHGSHEMKVIAVADHIHTLQTLITNVSEYGLDYFRCLYRGPEDQLWFVDQLCVAIGHGFKHPLLEEYDELIDQFVDLLEDLDKNPISMPETLLYDEVLLDFGEPEKIAESPVSPNNPVFDPAVLINPIPFPPQVKQPASRKGRFEVLISDHRYEEEPEKPVYELLFMSKKKHNEKKLTADKPLGIRYLNAGEKKLLLPSALKLGINEGFLTSQILQDRLSINYKVAFRVLKELKRFHVISRADSYKPRQVYKDKAQTLLKKLGGNL